MYGTGRIDFQANVVNIKLFWDVQNEELIFPIHFRVCLKNYSRNLYAPLCGIFCSNSVAVACYDALIRAKSPQITNFIFLTRVIV